MSSIERLALRLEQESKIKPELSIGIRDEDIKNSIDSKHYVIRNLLQNDIEAGRIKSKSISRVDRADPTVLNLKNLNSLSQMSDVKAPILLDKSNIKRHKNNRDNAIYSIKGKQMYKGTSITNSHKELEDNSKVLSLGVVGENVGISSTRKGYEKSDSLKRKLLIGNSLDMKLPRIGDPISQDRSSYLRNQNSIDNIQLPNLNQYNNGKHHVHSQKADSLNPENPSGLRYKKYIGNKTKLRFFNEVTYTMPWLFKFSNPLEIHFS